MGKLYTSVNATIILKPCFPIFYLFHNFLSISLLYALRFLGNMHFLRLCFAPGKSFLVFLLNLALPMEITKPQFSTRWLTKVFMNEVIQNSLHVCSHAVGSCILKSTMTDSHIWLYFISPITEFGP